MNYAFNMVNDRQCRASVPTFEVLIYPYLETWHFIECIQEANNPVHDCRASEVSIVNLGPTVAFIISEPVERACANLGPTVSFIIRGRFYVPAPSRQFNPILLPMV